MFNVGGFIDHSFATDKIKLLRVSGDYVDGIWTETRDEATEHRANVQPLNPKERLAIEEGGQRLLDARKIYISDGSAPEVLPSDRIVIEGIEGEYEVVQSDIRKTRQYCKIIVSKVDE